MASRYVPELLMVPSRMHIKHEMVNAACGVSSGGWRKYGIDIRFACPVIVCHGRPTGSG